MRTIKGRLTLICKTGLLIIGSLVLARAVGAAEEAAAVRFAGDTVSVSAQHADLGSIVAQIADHFGLRLVLHMPVDRKIVIDFEQKVLREALSLLLTTESYQLFLPSGTGVETERAIPGTLWIFAEGTAVAYAAVVFLEEALVNGTFREKKEAIRELRRLGSTEAVQALSLALGDDNRRIRGEAMAALRRIGSDEAMAAIASTMSTSDPVLRGQAVAALASGNADTAAQYLSLALDDADPRVRIAAVEALADVPHGSVPAPAAIAALNRALQDEDEQVRMQAVDSLEEIGGDVAYQSLMRLKRDQDDEVARAAREALSSAGT